MTRTTLQASYLDTEQQRQLEAAIEKQLREPLDLASWQANRLRAAVLVRFLLHTGLQSVEARALRLGDIRLGERAGVVHVLGRRERRVPLDDPTCNALRVWLAARPEGDVEWLWLEGDSGNAHGLSGRGVWRACRRMAHLASLDPESVTPRTLRITCAHNLLAAGESPRVVMRLLRLSSTDMVLRCLRESANF
ncbi:MAG: site-specific integrase [Anaerolineales bacterium]|nr:site-specific integrase [Anaerolineales bacterium]